MKPYTKGKKKKLTRDAYKIFNVVVADMRKRNIPGAFDIPFVSPDGKDPEQINRGGTD